MSAKPKPKPVIGTTKLTSDIDAIVESVGKENGGWHTISAAAISGIS